MTWVLRVFMNSIAYGVADVLNFAANLFCVHVLVVLVALTSALVLFTCG